MRNLIDIATKAILHERVVNVFNDTDKAKHAGEVFDLIDRAYGYVGGHSNYRSPETLLGDDSWWKLIRLDGQIVALAIYKRKHGRKRVALATDGTERGKEALYKMIAEDMREQRGWSEASGKAAKLLVKFGMPPIHNDHAEELLGKDILAQHGQFKYDRIIGGHVHTKMILGYPEGIRYEFVSFNPDEVSF
jgi:hypothetical protein